MAFRQFNIQLLPLDSSKTDDVGVEGYKKLFELLGAEVSAAHEARTLDKTAFELPNDTRFSPFYVHFEMEYAHGSFIKYHRADLVSDMYTALPLFKASPTAAAVSNSHQLPYVFAYENHRLAIDEQGGKLPATPRMLEALLHFLDPLAANYFPAHTLQVTLIAEKKALTAALAEAEGFRKVEVSLTFQNGPRFDAQLDEMREKNVHHVDVKAAPERGGLMTSLPGWLKDFVEASTQYGQAFLSYVKQNGKSAHFRTDHFPEKFSVRRQKNELWADYLDRIFYKAVGKTPPKKVTAKKVLAKKLVRKRILVTKKVT